MDNSRRNAAQDNNFITVMDVTTWAIILGHMTTWTVIILELTLTFKFYLPSKVSFSYEYLLFGQAGLSLCFGGYQST